MSDDDHAGEGGAENPAVATGGEGNRNRFQLVYKPSPVIPPDGGYGWVVVIAAFFVNLIADGVTFSFGILLSELFKSLDDTREDISWIGSFLAGVPLLLGPVTSLLIDRFGCRAVTLSGGLISGVGFALMFILPQSTLLFVFSAGLLSGFGLGLVFMPAVVAVSFYFLEKRSLATGVSMSGSGVGTVVFAYITRACIEEYTWRGSFLIIGGILLNVCICGALYRPLEPSDLKKMKRMNKLYIQFQANNCRSADAEHHGSPPLALPPLSPTTPARESAATSSAESSSDGSSSSSTSSPVARKNAARALAEADAATAAAFAAKSLLAIPTYLSEEFNSQQQQRQQQQQQRRRQRSRHRASPRQSSSPRGQDERELIASLKLGYLQRLTADAAAASAAASAIATAATTDCDPLHCSNGGVVGGGGGALAKASTSHELVDYAHRIAKQQKLEKRRQLLELQQQQLLLQQQQHEEEEAQQRRLSIVLCLPQAPQGQQQQQARVTNSHAAAAASSNIMSSHSARRQMFPVDRRYFMQHTRYLASCTTATYELWDSCPDFGRIPAAMHNRRRSYRTVAKASATGGGSLANLLRRLLKSKALMDMRFLFSSWDYVAFLASNFLLYFWYDITYTFLPDHAKEIGLSDSDISLIIGLIGVSNTIGQIAIGYVGDFPRVNSALLYALCMSLTGVANFLVPWCLNLASLLVYGIVYGFLVSANYSLCSIVIIDLFSLERLTTGYGFMMFFQGVANLVGPPAMGHMRDIDGNYNRAFVYSGIFVLVSNFLIVPVYRSLFRSAVKFWRCLRGRAGTEAAAAAAPERV